MKDFNRRDFLKYSGAVTGAAIPPPPFCGGTDISRESAATETTTIKEILGHVNNANIVVYDPGTNDAKRSKICITNMYGSSRATDALPNDKIKKFAAMGYRSANCAPQNGYFIDQVQYLSNCIDWIKKNIEGVEKIVLWGNSRGCNLQSAYQRIAENGAATFQGAGMFLPIPKMTLTPADGIIYCDANHGFMVNVLASLATNLVSDDSVMKRTAELDPLTAANGYLGAGKASYTDAFCKKIWKAQAQRYNRLLNKAKDRMAIIKAGNGMFSDDEPFTVVMGFGNVNAYQLYSHDIRFFSRTKGPCKLLHKDGTISTEVVPSLRKADRDPGNFKLCNIATPPRSVSSCTSACTSMRTSSATTRPRFSALTGKTTSAAPTATAGISTLRPWLSAAPTALSSRLPNGSTTIPSPRRRTSSSSKA